MGTHAAIPKALIFVTACFACGFYVVSAALDPNYVVPTDYYEILGIDRNAFDEAQLKRQWRKRSVELHPDQNRNNPNAEANFRALREAYEVLQARLGRLAVDCRLVISGARQSGMIAMAGREVRVGCVCRTQRAASITRCLTRGGRT